MLVVKHLLRNLTHQAQKNRANTLSGLKVILTHLLKEAIMYTFLSALLAGIFTEISGVSVFAAAPQSTTDDTIKVITAEG
jgi:hypothetical protein